MDWQLIATGVVILMAAVIVSRRVLNNLSRKSKTPCGSCGGCSGAKSSIVNGSPLVQLGMPESQQS